MKPLSVAAFLVLNALGPASADDAIRGDLAKLQGNWSGVIGRRDNIPVVVEIRGRSVSASFTAPDGEKRTLRGEIRLDESVSPKAVDWINFKAQNGDDLPDNLGIYELDGDSFKVCNGGRDKPRPTEFKESEGGTPTLILLTRQKDDASDDEPKP